MREREADGLGEGGRPEPDGERDQEKQLRVPGPGHARHDRRHHLGSEIGERDEDERRLAERDPDRGRPARFEIAEGGQEHRQDHDRQILHQGDARPSRARASC